MLLIYTSKATPRFNYTCNWIFGQLMSDWKVTENIEDYRNHAGAKIFYDKIENPGSGLLIHPAELIKDDLLHSELPVKSTIEEMPVLYRDVTEFGFDIFSAVFFMLSRYEEYLPFEGDAHYRFPASQTLAFQNSFLQLPVCDMWVDYLKEYLIRLYPGIQFITTKQSCILTYDIDVAFKFRGRKMTRRIASILKDLSSFNFKRIIERLKVMSGTIKDPWDISDYVKVQAEKIGADCVFFFPAGQKTEYDRSLDLSNQEVTALISRIKQFAHIGIHPSYFSPENKLKLQQEMKTLERVAGLSIFQSRQHFLRFKIPDTFLNLSESGIREDFSMAFPDMNGFRAGTSHPFNFYDLKNECETGLKIFPSCIMDQTCIHYLKYSAEDSWEIIKKYIDLVFRYNGIFIPIFHNDHLAGKDWMEIHDRMTTYILNHETTGE